MILKIFIEDEKLDCCKCLEQWAKRQHAQIVYFDKTNYRTHVARSFYQINALPSVVLTDSHHAELWSWHGKLPTVVDLIERGLV